MLLVRSYGSSGGELHKSYNDVIFTSGSGPWRITLEKVSKNLLGLEAKQVYFILFGVSVDSWSSLYHNKILTAVACLISNA